MNELELARVDQTDRAVAPMLKERFTLHGSAITVDHIAGGALILEPGVMSPMLWVEGNTNQGQRVVGWVRRAGTWGE